MWLSPARSLLRSMATRPALARSIFTSKVLALDPTYDENFHSVSVNVVHREMNNYIFIQSYSNYGFRLTTGVFVLGPVAVLPTAMFSWTVATHHDVNVKSLALFWMMEPKVDILIIGTGDKKEPIDPDIREFLRSKKISWEVQDTRAAISAYNYLAGELRNVGAALIPPQNMVAESIEEGLVSYNIKRNFFQTNTTEDENVHDDYYLKDAFHQREMDKWWAGEYGQEKMAPGMTRDYQEKLLKWKAQKVAEDDAERANLKEDFVKKTERDLMNEKAKQKSIVEKDDKEEK